MKRIKNILYAIAILPVATLMLSGCQEKDLELYQDDPLLYFEYDKDNTGTRQKDYINQSFFGKRFTQINDTLTLYINMSGLRQDFDRPLALRQTNTGEKNAAIEGVHFASFDSEYVKNSMVVKANARRAEVKIIIHKYENYDDPDNSLDQNVKELKLEIVENEYFRPGMQVERQNFFISMTSLAEKPVLWDTFWYQYFGPTWGTVKFAFIIGATGYTDWEVKPSDQNYLRFLNEAVETAVFDYEQEHPDDPLRELNGDLIVFKI